MENQELKMKEMEQAAGGNIIDDAICFVKGHDWEWVGNYGDAMGRFEYTKYRCSRCGKEKYEATDKVSHNTREISYEEFKAAVSKS